MQPSECCIFRMTIASVIGSCITLLLVRGLDPVVALIHGRAAIRPMMALGGICFLLILPGLVSAEINGGLITYLRECLAVSRQEGARTASTRVTLSIDTTQPLVVHLPGARRDAGTRPAHALDDAEALQLGVVHLDAAVAAIGDVDVAGVVRRDAVRGVELVGRAAALAEGLHPVAVLVELENGGLGVATNTAVVVLRVAAREDENGAVGRDGLDAAPRDGF